MSSAFLACPAQPDAVPSGATESCAANRKGCGWVIVPLGYSSGSHDLAAVHVEHMARYPSGMIGQQEHARAD